MSQFLIFIAFCIISVSSTFGQTPCVGGRYNVKAFSVDTLKDVVYGQNINSTGILQNLTCDIFLPKADTCPNRPVLVLAHGGTFLVGNKDIIDVKVLANEFAKRGYVCVSMNYRLGIKIIGGGTLQEEFAGAVWRGSQDGRAMIRYLRRSADKLGNLYAIDTNSIYMGGSSAGAVLALYVAFLDQSSEIPIAVDTIALGGIEGDSGSPGYSSKVKGILNLSGGLPVSLNSMNNNPELPLLNVHGPRDNVVPYKCDSFNFAGMNVELMCGSFSIDSLAKLNGNPSTLYTMIGESHVPWLNGNGIQFVQAKKHLFDSAEVLLEKFLYSQVVGSTKIKSTAKEISLKQYGRQVIILSKSRNGYAEIIDMAGRVIWRQKIVVGYNEFRIESTFAGVVLVRVTTDLNILSRKIYLEPGP